MRLIGLNGLMGSGKDTTYAFIAEHHPGALRVAFADKLKEIAARSIGLDGSSQFLIGQMDECKKYWKFSIGHDFIQREDDRRFTGRQYLQWLGANARIVFGDTFWIDQVLPQKRFVHLPEKAEGLIRRSDAGSYLDHDALAERYPDTDLAVVTDVRYPNEAERIQQLGGEVWEILRPGLTSDGHSSEMLLERHLIDREINNDGDLAQLSARVKENLNA